MHAIRRQALPFLAVLVLCVGCDHGVKRLAERTLERAPISVAGDFVRLQLAHNEGAALNLGATLPAGARSILFLVVVPLGLAGLCGWALLSGLGSGPALLGLALIAGGGAGNWLDRVLNGGSVTDFVSLGFGPLRTGIFNLADVCIVAGVLLFALGSSKQRGPELDA